MSTARSLRPSRRVIVAAAAALAVLVPVAAAHAASAQLPWVTISPLNGTPDASPTTQISFLGVGAKDITRISVRGNRSGRHRGTLKPYATGSGASYVLLRPFTPAAGSAPTALEPVGSPVASTGFETPMTVASTAPYIAVEALGPSGQVLATSPAVGAVAS